MSFHPTTQRLILRAPMMSDMKVFVRLLNDYEVVKNLQQVPYPYTDAHFREYLARTDAERRDGTDFNMAVTRAMDGAFLGLVSVHRHQTDATASIGYWYGRPYWGQGYATEAAQPMLRFAFEDLGAVAVTSGFFADNPNSGHVLEKLGFTAAGTKQLPCVSRGCDVTSNRVLLTKEQFARKKAA
jgi:ribosomal-protein-alanine N-acetyltransferase